MFKVEAVVVGAGVVGLAIARALALRGVQVLLLEKEGVIGSGTSSRNSEVIHAGLYYEPESLKAQFCVRGRDMLYRYCDERRVPHRRCGKLVVATDQSEEAYLGHLLQRALRNGVRRRRADRPRAFEQPRAADTGHQRAPVTFHRNCRQSCTHAVLSGRRRGGRHHNRLSCPRPRRDRSRSHHSAQDRRN